MNSFRFTFLCALGLCAALRVSASLEEDADTVPEGTVLTSSWEQNEIVNMHNTVRRNVNPTASNMLKMSWNNEAAANAQKWANACYGSHGHHSHREISTSGCDENIHLSNSKESWSNVIQWWADKVKNWRYGVGSFNGGSVYDYTKIVWYRSSQIGCAVAYCPTVLYKYFYVCHYCPPGREHLTHPYKSGPTCADCPNASENKLCTNPCLYDDLYSDCPELTEKWGCNSNFVSTCRKSCKCSSQLI